MNHLPQMILDLALILGAAAASTLVFSKLRQPIVLGYLIAGFAVGPHFPLGLTVTDSEGVKLWAEIGVIFLLFGLGLEFSFKKLAKVGKSAFIAASFEIFTMSIVGYFFGRALGWTNMDSIFLGAILSMSSTTIIIRAYEEAGLKGTSVANLVFGILIVEDLMAILIMVILSEISTPGLFSGTNLLYLSARLVFFLLAWFIVGIYVLPTILRYVRHHLSNEILLVVSIALCLLMVVLATKAKFSAALGAFIMGSILAETKEGKRIEHLLLPVKDLFAAVFFVSVGMMIDPVIIREHFGVVMLITFITIVGKLLGSGFGAVISGRSLKHSTQAGMSLSQIGEFSFIIATLGMSLKVVSDFLYPIIIAVSAVTTFTTPYMIRYSDKIYSKIEKHLPRDFLAKLARYERSMSHRGKESAFKLLWRKYGMVVLLNSVVVIGIGLSASTWAWPFIRSTFGDTLPVRIISCAIALIICSPFLAALLFKSPYTISEKQTESILRLRRLRMGVSATRGMIGLILIDFIINVFARTAFLPFAVLVATPLLIFIFKNRISRFYLGIEDRFLKNLNAKEISEIESQAKRIILDEDSHLAGKTLGESKFRTVTGATIGMIVRDGNKIFAPDKSEKLLAGDELYVIGTALQMAEVWKYISSEVIKNYLPNFETFKTAHSPHTTLH